jgi:general secretion pathway protein G
MIQRLQAKRNEKGFTLIELLIVIIVLGILAAIVVFAVGATRKDSVAAACKTDFKSVELSAEASNTKMGIYPATAGELLASATPNKGGLLKVHPVSSDYTLTYAQTGSGTGFTITVTGTGLTTGTTTAACG